MHEISNNVACATTKASDKPAHTRSLIRAFARGLNNPEGSSESTLVKMSNCWKSHAAAHIAYIGSINVK